MMIEPCSDARGCKNKTTEELDFLKCNKWSQQHLLYIQISRCIQCSPCLKVSTCLNMYKCTHITHSSWERSKRDFGLFPVHKFLRLFLWASHWPFPHRVVRDWEPLEGCTRVCSAVERGYTFWIGNEEEKLAFCLGSELDIFYKWFGRPLMSHSLERYLQDIPDESNEGSVRDTILLFFNW